MNLDHKSGSVTEYVTALKQSDKFGPQVIDHRIFPATPGSYLPVDFLIPELRQALSQLGVKQLYTHQQQAIKHILQGQNVIVATPTASGKSYIYNLPVFQEQIKNSRSKALYLFPLKALAQDQLKAINTLTAHLQLSLTDQGKATAAIYDGDTNAYQRKKIRDKLPGILITNPDMLHLSMLPYHDKWTHLFTNLTHVVIDEVHTYRGIFGSHVAWLIRRLKRICSLYGSHPSFILASATIGNPKELAEKLIDDPVKEIVLSGAPKAARHVILLNPLESAAAAAVSLLEAGVHRDLRTIVYCQSRKMTELITMWTDKRLKDKKGCIASYRAGFLPAERRLIEERLANGSLLGVISTSALELGIDIGNLDLCILVGYPGSMMATWQRAGRVGRSMRKSMVAFIGHEDALDQHFMRSPDDFFTRPIEPVTLNPDNPRIARQQLTCLAAEIPITRQESFLSNVETLAIIEKLTAKSVLMQSADGATWFSSRKYPQREVDLRGSSNRYPILLHENRQVIGEIDGYRALKECHPGAIYLHMAQSYHVARLDLEDKEVLVAPVKPKYFTKVLADKNTEILTVKKRCTVGSTTIGFGTLRVTEKITGYRKIAIHSMRVIARHPLDLPPQIFETEGFWIEIPEWIQKQTESQRLHFMGGIHALEHALIGMLPLLVLCDRNDIGGIAHPHHPQLEGPAVFVYDGYAGGMGLTAKAMENIEQLVALTRQTVSDCSCERGCPSCVHSPKCGSGNRPIDKDAGLFIMEKLSTTEKKQPIQRVPVHIIEPSLPNPTTTNILPQRFCVFDVETQKSAQEVGGWHRADRMLISIAVLYDSEQNRCFSFKEQDIPGLIERLFSFDLIVGFNNKRFDNKVLSAYTKKNLTRLPSLDLLEEISNQLGYRLSLDRLAERTLKIKKSGDGLQALQWFKQGRMGKLTQYCQQDVEITRDLFLFGLRQQYLLFQNKAGKEVRLPVSFEKTIRKIIGDSSCLVNDELTRH